MSTSTAAWTGPGARAGGPGGREQGASLPPPMHTSHVLTPAAIALPGHGPGPDRDMGHRQGRGGPGPWHGGKFQSRASLGGGLSPVGTMPRIVQPAARLALQAVAKHGDGDVEADAETSQARGCAQPVAAAHTATARTV